MTSKKDTFIYNEASDSRIDFNTMRGFDIIAYFEGSNDVINLGKVVDLQGTIKNGNTKGGGGKMAGKAFAVNKAGDTLEKFIDNGDGVFETSASGQLGNNKHSIVLVDTQEDGLPQWSAAATVATKSIDFSAKVQDVNVKWVLVDCGRGWRFRCRRRHGYRAGGQQWHGGHGQFHVSRRCTPSEPAEVVFHATQSPRLCPGAFFVSSSAHRAGYGLSQHCKADSESTPLNTPQQEKSRSQGDVPNPVL